jgi:hypothetical protein
MTYTTKPAPRAGHACVCGQTFRTLVDLDDHFHEVFTPPDDIGTDGQVHAEVGRDHD